MALVGLPSWVELTVVLLLGLLLFGKKLPGLAHSLGQAIIEFRRAAKGTTDGRSEDGSKTHGKRMNWL